VKLTDFGTAVHEADGGAESLAGSPFWMSPEAVEMAGATSASDIWSVGATVVELVSGKPPYFVSALGVCACARPRLPTRCPPAPSPPHPLPPCALRPCTATSTGPSSDERPLSHRPGGWMSALFHIVQVGG
jgi:serine/threonine protein kinase